MAETRFIICETCGGEGRELCGHPNDPHPRDCGPCPACEGERVIEIEVEPVTLEDISHAPTCAGRWSPSLRNIRSACSCGALSRAPA